MLGYLEAYLFPLLLQKYGENPFTSGFAQLFPS